MESGMQKYLVEHDIERVLKDLLATMLWHQPTNPLNFMVQAIQVAQKQKEKEKEKEKTNFDYLHVFRDVAKHYEFSLDENNKNLKRKVSFPSEPPNPQKQPAPIHIGVNFNRKRRGSVSAESLKPTEEEKSDRTIIPKTDEARRRIFSAIAHNLLFRNLESDQRHEVMDAMFERKVDIGEVVIQQGDEGDNFYVVDEGVFDIFVNGVKVVEVGPGGSFGELALMYNTKRAATVQAQTPAILWAVDRMTFRRIIMNNTFRKRKLYEGFLKTVPILQNLDTEELVKIADALEPQGFFPGDVIIEEGDVGDCFYIIVEGEVKVTKKSRTKTNQKKNEDKEDENSSDEEKVNELGPGNYFGELALLTDKTRAATVTATTNVICAVLDTKAFIRLLGPVVEVLKRNAETYAKYKEELQE